MKRLILCCDGTWNSADQEHNGVPCPTNVVKLGYRIAKRDGDVPQIIYYDEGVGTAGNLLDHFSGGAFGEGLEDNIHDAYRFLVANYEPDDEIYLFGFSRGAFTARSIGGMIRKCGILKRAVVQRYHDALLLYRNEDHPNDDAPARFRKNNSVCGSQDIAIKFIGVWDTVGALGIPLPHLGALTRSKYEFHDTQLSGTVQYAYHALAIDEHREPFAPTLWWYEPKPGQTVEQVWFCGAHSDVGGGYAEHGLSDIALEWMIAKAKGSGLAFDADAMQTHPICPDYKQALHNSKTGVFLAAPGINRVIGFSVEKPGAAPTPDATQSLHPSVLDRWKNVPDYRPASLVEYFKRTGKTPG